MGGQRIPERFRAVHADKGGYVLGEIMDYQIHCIISFTGQLNEEILQRAYEISLNAEPVLGCRFVYDAKEPYWQRLDLPLNKETFEGINTADSETMLQEFIAEPFDPLVGPQIKLRIFRSTNDLLCIKANHLPTDGASVKEYAYLLSDIYINLLKDKDYTVRPNINGSRSYRQVGDRLSILDKLKVIRRFILDLKSKKAHWRTMGSVNEGSSFVMVSRSIARDQFRAIKKYGKEHDATINDMLIAAYFRAIYKTAGPCEGVTLGIMTTADHRKRYLPNGLAGAICNLSGFYFSNIGFEPGADFDETLQKVVRDINSRKDDFIGLGEIPMSSFIFNMLPYALAQKIFRKVLDSALGHGGLSAGFTNLGIIDPEQLDFGPTSVNDAYMVVPSSIKPKNSIIIGVTTFMEKLNLISSFIGRPQDRRQLEELMDNLLNELPS